MVTRQLDDVSPTTIWFVGHQLTGAELGKQADALGRAGGLEHPPAVSILSAFARIPDGAPTAVIGIPSNTTWARARHGHPRGPQPLRDRQWPWGLPWLSPTDRDIVEHANGELRYIMTVITEALRRSPETFIMLLHPEQLGPAQRGTPASIWDLPELRVWARRAGMMRAATFQCRFESTDFRMPTGILVSHRLNSKLFNLGWPWLHHHAPHYRGPLPSFCACGRPAHRSRQSPKGRVQHRAEAPLIKDSLLRYLLAVICRESTGLPVAELLRKGPPLSPQVRDDPSHLIESSQSQETWVPSDSQPETFTLTPRHAETDTPLHWDRELSGILGLTDISAAAATPSAGSGTRSSSTTSARSQDHSVDNFQDQEIAHGQEEVVWSRLQKKGVRKGPNVLSET